MRKSIAIVWTCAAILLPRYAFAWGSAGHEVIAAEAFRQLPPEFKAEAIEVLKAHPDYAQWEASYHPNATVDLYAYIFMRSSTWPDEIRNSGSLYDHPHWHFIDYPLRPPDFPMLPSPTPDDDVLFGVAQCEKVLSDTNATPELRAAMLSYLIHLVGDMHQPLHCASLFNANYPTGDRGGNDIYVMPGNWGVPLHGIWDGLLGSSANTRAQWNYAIALDARFPRTALPELAMDTTPKSWSLESRELAIEKGYLHGKLQGATNQNAAPNLPANYLANAKQVAEKQGALAGYRLADEIEKYLKWAAPVPLLPVNTFIAAEAPVPKKIGALEARNFYDESMIVTGKVVQVSEHPNIAILEIDQPYPDTPLTAVIFPVNAGAFGNLQRFNHRAVEISGDITEYRGKPEIVLESTNQVIVVGGN
jgi:hypothetical protein